MIEIYGNCPTCTLLCNMLETEGIEFEHITNHDKVMAKARFYNVMYMPIVINDGLLIEQPYDVMEYVRILSK